MIPGVSPNTLLSLYGPSVALAFVTAWVTMRIHSQRAGLPDLGTPFVLSAIAGALGARAFYLSSIGAFSGAELFSFQAGGMTLAGGLVVAIAVSALLVRWWTVEHRPPYLWWRWMDCVAPAFAVGVIIERVGAFLAGVDFGSYAGPTDIGHAFAVRYPAGSLVHRYQEMHLQQLPGWSPEQAAPVHPVQLYTALAGLAMLLLARSLRGRVHTHGVTMLTLLGLFIGVHLVILESFRFGASEIVWGPLHLHQIGGLGLLVALGLAARQLVFAQAQTPQAASASGDEEPETDG